MPCKKISHVYAILVANLKFYNAIILIIIQKQARARYV